MQLRSLTRYAVTFVMIGSFVSLVGAQAPPKTAGETYLAYLAAMAKAKKVEEITQFMPAKNLAELKKTPPAQVPEMFDMLKTMVTMNTSVKVVKETPTPAGATLDVSGIGPDKKPVKGTIEMVKEGGAWKVGNESWKN